MSSWKEGPHQESLAEQRDGGPIDHIYIMFCFRGSEHPCSGSIVLYKELFRLYFVFLLLPLAIVDYIR